MLSTFASHTSICFCIVTGSFSIPRRDESFSATVLDIVVERSCSIHPYGYSISESIKASGSISGERAIFITTREVSISVLLSGVPISRERVAHERIQTVLSTELNSGTDGTRRVLENESNITPFSLRVTIYGTVPDHRGDTGIRTFRLERLSAWRISGSFWVIILVPEPNIIVNSALVIFLVALNTVNTASNVSPLYASIGTCASSV